jgi:hypothetical protein
MGGRGLKTSPNRFCAGALALAFSTLACSIDVRSLTVADSGAGGRGTAGSGGRNGGVDGASDGFGTSTGIVLTPSWTGTYDGSNAAGVVGAWWSTGDDYSSAAVLGAGTCPLAGFPIADCSVIIAPTPGQPFVPDPNLRMCTSGIVAQVMPDDGSTDDYTAIWGNMIAFDLNYPLDIQGDGRAEAGVGGVDSGVGTRGQYDAPGHGVTGFAFDIYTPPGAGNFRVEFTTQGTEDNVAYSDGATSNFSPVTFSGHYEIRWPDVGGPLYLVNNGTTPPPFDPSKLETVRFHVITNAVAPVPYSFCISNVIALTN